MSQDHGEARALSSDRAVVNGAGQAVSALRASVPSAAIIALEGDRYSPNLRSFLLRRRKPWRDMQSVYQDQDNALWIGWVDDDLWFMGCRLMRVLVAGTKAEVYAYPHMASQLTELPDFWARYSNIGRCAIDPLHRGWWHNGASRWKVEGDVRRCLWCGEHMQRLRRWTETVERERWELASAMSARSDETSMGSVCQDASAVGAAETPIPGGSHDQQ